MLAFRPYALQVTSYKLLKAGETKKLPVIFFVDPAMEEERGAQDIRTITLSYTFFNTDEFTGATKTASLN